MHPLTEPLTAATRASITLPPSERPLFIGKHLLAQAQNAKTLPTATLASGTATISKAALQQELVALAKILTDRNAVRGARLSGEGCPGGVRGQRPPLGESGLRGSEGGGAEAAHWLPTRPPSTGAAIWMNIVLLSGCTHVLGEDFRQGCRAMFVLSMY